MGLPLACLFLLIGCSDTERSWAYKFRLSDDDRAVTPRDSHRYRTKEECEKGMAEVRSVYVPLDRCVLQPAIPVWWIEWEASLRFAVQAPNEPRKEDSFSFIAQSLSDCRKVRGEMLAKFQTDMSAAKAESATWSLSGSWCKPVYMPNRSEYTPLQVSDFEGVLLRWRLEKK